MAAEGEATEAAAGGGAAPETSVVVHPIVVFSVLDHYIRRQETQERVIGTLLGYVDEDTGVVEVTNAYAVPHTESGGEVAVGQAFNKSMFGPLSRVNPEERVVGWYATGAGGEGDEGALLNESSSLIHDFYSRECDAPVHVVVDCGLKDGKGIEAEAYAGNERPPDPETGEEVAREFVPLKTSLTFSDGERVCIDRMIRGQGDEPFESAESLAELPTEHDDVKDDFNDLLDSIDDILAYAKLVQKGEVVPDPKVARCIGDALAALPKIEPGLLDGTQAVDTQDIVMVSYLASITKAQLAIASKIHESF